MDINKLQDLCRASDFSLEMHAIPSTSKYFAILIPLSGEKLELAKRKAELDALQQKLMELCPSIEYVTVQCGSD